MSEPRSEFEQRNVCSCGNTMTCTCCHDPYLSKQYEADPSGSSKAVE